MPPGVRESNFMKQGLLRKPMEHGSDCEGMAACGNANGVFAILPAELLLEVAFRSPLQTLRQVVRFDVRLVACVRLQRWFRRWCRQTGDTVLRVGDRVAVHGSSASPGCRYTTLAAELQAGDRWKLRLLNGEYVSVHVSRIRKLEEWADGPWASSVGSSSALHSASRARGAATRAAAVATMAMHSGISSTEQALAIAAATAASTAAAAATSASSAAAPAAANAVSNTQEAEVLLLAVQGMQEAISQRQGGLEVTRPGLAHDMMTGHPVSNEAASSLVAQAASAAAEAAAEAAAATSAALAVNAVGTLQVTATTAATAVAAAEQVVTAIDAFEESPSAAASGAMETAVDAVTNVEVAVRALGSSWHDAAIANSGDSSTARSDAFQAVQEAAQVLGSADVPSFPDVPMLSRQAAEAMSRRHKQEFHSVPKEKSRQHLPSSSGAFECAPQSMGPSFMPFSTGPQVVRILHCAAEIAGSPMLVRTATGRSEFAFLDAVHSTARAFDWHQWEASAISRHLDEHSYVVFDGVLSSSDIESVASYSHTLHARGGMQAGKLDDNDARRNDRGDVICGVSSTDQSCQALGVYVRTADKVYASLARHLPELPPPSRISRSVPMFAIYPGGGARYVRHVDNSHGNCRILTCILYLNRGWVPNDGGCLRLVASRGGTHKGARSAGIGAIDIAPVMNRLVLFWSDVRMPHEVLPAASDRAACTLWYIDRAALGRPGDQPLPSSEALCARLLSELQRNRVAVRMRLLGMTAYTLFRSSLPMRLCSLTVVVNHDSVTLGWLPDDDASAAPEDTSTPSDPAGHKPVLAPSQVSLIRAIRGAHQDLIAALPTASVASAGIAVQIGVAVQARMLLVQHACGSQATSEIPLLLPVPRAGSLFFVYCLGLGHASVDSHQENCTLRLLSGQETTCEVVTSVPMVAVDTLSIVRCPETVHSLRLTGAFTALIICCH